MATGADSFPGTNADLGVNWTAQTADVLSRADGALANSGGNPAGEYWNVFTPGAAQFSEVVLTATLDNTADMGFGGALRMSTSDNSCYWVAINTSAADRFQLIRRNASASTPLGSPYAVTAPQAGDIVRLEVDAGYVLRLYINTVLRITFDDVASGSKIASGRVGLFGEIVNTVAKLASWSGGDLAPAYTGQYQKIVSMQHRMGRRAA